MWWQNRFEALSPRSISFSPHAPIQSRFRNSRCRERRSTTGRAAEKKQPRIQSRCRNSSAATEKCAPPPRRRNRCRRRCLRWRRSPSPARASRARSHSHRSSRGRLTLDYVALGGPHQSEHITPGVLTKPQPN